MGNENYITVFLLETPSLPKIHIHHENESDVAGLELSLH